MLIAFVAREISTNVICQWDAGNFLTTSRSNPIFQRSTIAIPSRHSGDRQYKRKAF